MTSFDSIFKDINKISKSEAIERLHISYSIADSKKTRIKILEMLNELQDKTHFEEIENYFISDEDPEVRIEAAKLLAFNYNERKAKAIQPLIWVLEHEKKNELKLTAIRLLVPLAYRREYRSLIIESLKKMLKSSEDNLKIEVIESLGFLKEESAATDFVELLKSSNKQIRISAIEALDSLNHYPKTATQYLLDSLGLDNYILWRYAFETLKKKLNLNLLIEKLLKILEETKVNDDDLNIGYLRRGIIKALGELGDKRAVNSLLNALKDWHYWVREEAVSALDKIEPKWKIKYRTKLKKNNINVK
ncbi:MAG: HEAT repeat domain-containing protein [Promethearchaeota archaeon]